MKRAIVVLAAVLFLCLPVVAEELATEATGSFSWSDNGELRVWEVGGAIDFPVGSVVQIGPVFQLGEARTAGSTSVRGLPMPGTSLRTCNLGARATFNLTGRDGLFISVGAMANNTGGDKSYTLVPEAGLKFGGDEVFVRLSASHAFMLNDDHDNLIDLETLKIVAAIGVRF